MEQVREYFDMLGGFLVDFFRLDQPGRGKEELQQEIQALEAGKKNAVRTYYVKKIQIFLLILMMGSALMILSVLFWETGELETVSSLKRPEYGGTERMESLEVHVEGDEKVREMDVKVQAQTYTEQEKQEKLEQALEELEQILPGENTSLDEVRSDLVLPQSLVNGAVKVSWILTPYGVLEEDGRLIGAESEEGTMVELQGTLECSGTEVVHTVYVKVFPPELSEEEALQKAISREVDLANSTESTNEVLRLPEQVDGRKLTWKRGTGNPVLSVLAFTMVVAVCVFLQMDQEVHKRAEERKRQLILDYPDLMWKMTMLLGAGLSIRGTFIRINQEYQKEKNKEVRFVFEEVRYTCLEMESGIPEAQAYERFGRRCQLPEYIRLGTVLSQNLKKGAKGLTAMLETEAEASLNDRKNYARKIGEQAGTKLLLPMVLMLGIVLVILMVPAFLSF